MHKINVSLVFATKDKQWMYEAQADRGLLASELLEKSDFLMTFSNLW